MTQDYDSFIFVHIEKCGGTSVRHMIYNAMKETVPSTKIHIPGITCTNTETLIYIPGLSILNLMGKKIFCVADHSHYGAARTLLHLKNPFYFSVLREPVSRVISHYYFFFSRDIGKTLLDLSEEEIIMGLETEIANLMTIKLAGYTDWKNPRSYMEKRRILEDLLPLAKENIAKHIHVSGILERLDESVKLLNQKNPFGFTFKVPEKKFNPTKVEKPVTENILKLIDDYCRYDIELYDFAVKTFDKQFSDAV